MSCPSPSSLLLLIHPDHMERGLFMFVSAHAQKSIRAYLFAQFFFLTVNSYFEDYLFMYIVYLRIYTYSQLLMTHLGFFISIHTPTIQPFQKEHPKKPCVAFSVWPRRAVVLLESVEGTATEALPKSIAWMQAWRLWMFVARSWKSHFPWLPSQIAKLLDAQLLNRFEISSWD